MIDVAIIGGGVAGLWTLHRLRSLGYDAHLFEKSALGTGQTIASQGIIHGGIKYGMTKPISSSLAAMPDRWRGCLAGKGEIDLSGVPVLAERHELKCKARLISIPLWSFSEPVICCRGLLTQLRDGARGSVHRGPPVSAKFVVHTAGSGNEGMGIETQRRPLRMFMVRGMTQRLYAHYLDGGTKPRATITTHLLRGELVWYIGGAVAEQSVDWLKPEAYAMIADEMASLFPRIDWNGKLWAIHDVDRAEPANRSELPPGPVLVTHPDKDIAVAWPTKLALAPVVADRVIEWLESRGAVPARKCSRIAKDGPPPAVADLPWEVASWHRFDAARMACLQ